MEGRARGRSSSSSSGLVETSFRRSWSEFTESVAAFVFPLIRGRRRFLEYSSFTITGTVRQGGTKHQILFTNFSCAADQG
jgi:hypothetical protein